MEAPCSASAELGVFPLFFKNTRRTCLCRIGSEAEELAVRHTFSLVMAPVEGTPRSTVYIRLLGPFSARQASATFALAHSPLHTTLTYGQCHVSTQICQVSVAWCKCNTMSATIDISGFRSCFERIVNLLRLQIACECVA